jgi:hypothetical protein
MKEPEDDPAGRPFWEEIIDLGNQIPKEVWDKVPKDLAKNLDHYLYGAPKEEELEHSYVEQLPVEDQPLVSFQGRGEGCFKDATEVDAFLRAERETWED